MATKPLEKNGGDWDARTHCLRRMQCGCADRRATNGEGVADIVQLGILRMLEVLVAFLPGDDPAAALCGCG